MARKENTVDIQNLLRDAGLRSTAPRIGVLKILSTSKQPLSHNELYDRLSQHGFDKATIFRNLTDMTEAKLLSRIDVGDHVWRFEIRKDRDSEKGHAHFVCTDCGDVDCLPEFELKVSPKKALSPSAKMGHVSEILLKGHCGDCEEIIDTDA